MAKLRSLRYRLGRALISLLQTTSSKSIELSPNFWRKTLGAGSFKVFGFSRPAASRASRTLAISLPRIPISPVGHGRIDEFRVWHNHADVVVGANHRATGANPLHLTGDPRHFNTISDCDWSFGKNHQAADEIAGDILQPEADPHANRPCENSQRAEMNAGIFENNQNTNYQHDVA